MNTLRLHLLAHVEARHDYFADGLCRAIRFEPTPRCSDLITTFDLVVRANACRLSVHVPERHLQPLRDEMRAVPPEPTPTLDFVVRSVDPEFAYYTEDATPQTARIDLSDTTHEAQRYTLQWHSLKSIWCYWLVGEWDEKSLAIVDTRGERQFDALGPTALDGTPSRRAACFRSRAPLTLAERVPTGLQLRAGLSAAASRIVVSQLPAPRPAALQYENGPNGRQAVSEIFVSR